MGGLSQQGVIGGGEGGVGACKFLIGACVHGGLGLRAVAAVEVLLGVLSGAHGRRERQEQHRL